MGAALDFVAAGFRRGGLAGRPGGFEESFGAKFYGVGDFGGRVNRVLEDEGGFCGPGKEKSYGPAIGDWMRAKKGKRVGVTSGKEGVNARVEFGSATSFRGRRRG